MKSEINTYFLISSFENDKDVYLDNLIQHSARNLNQRNQARIRNKEKAKEYATKN